MKHNHQHRPIKHSKAKWKEKDPFLVPLLSPAALRKAMTIEKVAIGEYSDLLHHGPLPFGKDGKNILAKTSLVLTHAPNSILCYRLGHPHRRLCRGASL